MTRIEADPGALSGTARALEDATAVAREVHRGARALSEAAAATGSARLAEALGDFRHTWAYGLGLVVDDAGTLGRMLGQAAQVYAEADSTIAAACRP
ncbi:MAG: hypothetical protein QOE05_427 [Actinomycetota bacterium]|nr:hypothetical protein [Actinomycetota bacterium]